jgi:hypothetical protein
MLKIGDKVEVVEPFYWYEEDRHEIGEKFTIQEQHIGHNFEKFVNKIR